MGQPRSPYGPGRFDMAGRVYRHLQRMGASENVRNDPYAHAFTEVTVSLLDGIRDTLEQEGVADDRLWRVVELMIYGAIPGRYTDKAGATKFLIHLAQCALEDAGVPSHAAQRVISRLLHGAGAVDAAEQRAQMLALQSATLAASDPVARELLADANRRTDAETILRRDGQ